MKFFDYIKKPLLDSKNNKLISLYVKYSEHNKFVFIIYERIKYESNESEKTAKEIIKRLKEKKPIEGLGKYFMENMDSLRLDLESFFIFVRALMDDICKIIAFFIGNVKCKLPNSMNKLLFTQKYSKYKTSNPEFFKDLKKELFWLIDFIKKRDNLLHKLHDISIIGDSRGLCFGIGKTGDERGIQETTKNIREFIEDIISRINHLENIFLTKNIKKLNLRK